MNISFEISEVDCISTFEGNSVLFHFISGFILESFREYLKIISDSSPLKHSLELSQQDISVDGSSMFVEK